MSWTEIGSIPSETSKNTKYAISVNSEGDLGCKCMSWAHSLEKPKVCKHVSSAQAGVLLRQWQSSQKPPSRFFGEFFLDRRMRVVSKPNRPWGSTDSYAIEPVDALLLWAVVQNARRLVEADYSVGAPRRELRTALTKARTLDPAKRTQ